MPAPITTSLLVVGAVLTTVSPLAGCIVAALGAAWQLIVSVATAAGSKPDPYEFRG